MITLSEYLSSLDFDYKVNKNNTISLIDLQGANLAARVNALKEKLEYYKNRA